MNVIRSFYLSVCNRLYSVGKQQYENSIKLNNINLANIGQDTIIYNSGSICNLAADKTKINIGNNCHIYGLLTIFTHGGEIVIGNNCSLSEYSRIVSAKNISIGNRVMISHNVNILDNISHPINAVERHNDFIEHYSIGMQPHDIKPQAIIIEDDVWIGFNSTIMKGVKIGRGAIIGANSVVTKDVEAWTVNVGNPLRVIRKLDPIDF